MKTFVFLSGIINVLTGIIFIMPGTLQMSGLQIPENHFWLLFPAIFIFFLGIILMYCARDLQSRAPIVFWDGMSRVAAFFVFSWFGLFAGMGINMVLLAVPDLIIAIIYFVGIPRFLGRDFLSILFDRRN
jgi:hypothetical protein